MNKAIQIWLILFITSFSLFASSPTLDRDDLVVSVRAPKTVVPGQFETFILELTNEFAHPLAFQVKVNKPASWHFLSEVTTVELAPHEKRQVVFLLEVDRACEIGNQTILFEFFDEEHDIRLKESVITRVENVHQVEIMAVRKPVHLTGGEEFKVDFEIRNLGNCTEEIIVNSDGGQLQERKITLHPNSSEYVSVSHKVPADLSHVGYISCGITLKVEYQEEPIREITSVKAFPKSTKKTDPYNRFPIQGSVIYFGANNISAFEDSYQLELKGAGHLDRNKRHELEFVARGPNRFAIARVGNFDQYSLQYTWQKSRTSATTIRLGDFSYNLTDITEMFRWARGAGVSHKAGRYEVGGFFNTPRFYSEVKYQYAAYARYAITENWTGQLSSMQKFYAEGESPATLGSFKNEVTLKNQNIIAEISAGTRGETSGLAANLQADGRVKRFTYRSQTIWAGPDYPGYYTNSVFSNTFVNYRHNKWGANAGVFYNTSNPAQDTIFTTSPYSINYSAGVSLFPSKNWQLQVGYINRFKEDRFPDKKFAYRENATRYMASYRKDDWMAQLNGEVAVTENLLVAGDDNRGNTYNVRLRLEKTIMENLRIGGFTQYLYTNRYDRERTSFLLYGGNLSYQPWRYLRVSGGYRNNYLIEEYNSDRTLLDFNVQANYENHTFAINTSHALIRNTVGRTDFYINARYTYRFNAPISKRAGLYSLNGQLKSKNPRDAAGVIINIAGQSVITDEYGHFVVNDLPVGIHYLHIDKGTLGMGLVTETETPMEVEIFPQENNKVVINVVRGGSIVGKINFEMDQRSRMEGKKPPRKVVKVTNGDREFLTYTDEEGYFSFKNLLPGQWTVRVVQSPETAGTWQLSQNNLAVNVTPSNTSKVQFEMKTKVRKVKFSDKTLDIKIRNN